MTRPIEVPTLTKYECQHCRKSVETSATPILRAEDDPFPLGPPKFCQECALEEYFEHPTLDIRTEKRTSRAQGIKKDALTYRHTFAGADVDARLVGFQVDAHCVAVSALPRTPWGAPTPHLFVYQFDGVANPAVVIRWLVYRPNRDACLLVWWNANRHEVVYELVNLEAVSSGEAKALIDLREKLERHAVIGRPADDRAVREVDFRASLPAAIAKARERRPNLTLRQEDVAFELAMSADTFRRRLNEAGLTLDEVKRRPGGRIARRF